MSHSVSHSSFFVLQSVADFNLRAQNFFKFRMSIVFCVSVFLVFAIDSEDRL